MVAGRRTQGGRGRPDHLRRRPDHGRPAAGGGDGAGHLVRRPQTAVAEARRGGVSGPR
ncbi:hypothetical protein SGPA1_50188 [Streptomyces misionensis JCM 4497]